METIRIREASVKYGKTVTAPARITAPADAAKLVRKIVGGDAREHFVILHLDSRHAMVGYQIASIGTANASLVHPREVFQAAIMVGAVAIIVAHNHPSGDPSPSAEDRAVTERLVSAGKILGIPVVDHVVIGDQSFVSFQESGLI